MAERTQLRIFKGGTAQEFRNALENAIISRGGIIKWNAGSESAGVPCCFRESKSIHTLWIPFSNGEDFLLCKQIGASLGVPWIELRIQAGALWDFNLFKGEENIDNFSTMPGYWGGDEDLDEWRGKPELFASEWGVPKEKVEKYLVDWGCQEYPDGTSGHARTGKAYESDEFEYGDIWQMLDFLKAVGGTYPSEEGGLHHRIRFKSDKPRWKFWQRA